MEQNYSTALSAGRTLRALLLADPDVTDLVKVISPVIVAPETRLPYIVFRRVELETEPTKGGYRHAEMANIEVNCCAANYDQSLQIAEAVRHCLESRVVCPEGVPPARGIVMVSSEEVYEGDSYIQSLTFKFLI